MQYRGYRYTWGGTSPQTGFDCSGFVWYVYRQAGVAISRDLWGQYNTGSRIGRDALQPGDVVFFQNTYRPGLSHDGIYIGGGQFIQAASENTGVIVSSLSEPYWAARYLGARRPY
jgi:cell wall-associated NlpC family hydrolase